LRAFHVSMNPHSVERDDSPSAPEVYIARTPPEVYIAPTPGGNSAFHNYHNDFLDVEDPNERRRLALAKIDRAPFGWYHVRAVVVAGIGFFTDSYDIFAVGLLTTMLGIVYYPGVGIMPTNSDTAIKLSTSAGTIVGQLVFGLLADMVSTGRTALQSCATNLVGSSVVRRCTVSN
jgi:MFS transporter, PHS family, inorganic phosphate transporter